MKPIIIVLMLLASSIVYGKTCISDEGDRIERSKDFLHKVKLSSKISGLEIDVILNFPAQLEGLRFAKATLAKISNGDEEMEFIFPLDARQKNEAIRVWYMLSENIAENNVIQVVYGSPCGILVQYQLDYTLGKLIPQ